MRRLSTRIGGQRGFAKPEPGTPPPSDYRFVDRLDYMLNGEGFTYDRIGHLWLVDATTGEASRLTDGPTAEASLPGLPMGRGSPSRRTAAGTRICPRARTCSPWTSVARRHGRHRRSSVGLRPADVAAGRPVAGGTRSPAPRQAGSRNDIWVFAADGTDASPEGGRNLSSDHDLMPGSGMNSDVTIGDPIA